MAPRAAARKTFLREQSPENMWTGALQTCAGHNSHKYSSGQTSLVLSTARQQTWVSTIGQGQ